MKFPRPFTPAYWIDNDPDCLKYDHQPNVVAFPGAHARANAAQAAMLLETDRDEGRRIWAAYLAAIRRSVDAQTEVTNAHNAWMAYEGRARG